MDADKAWMRLASHLHTPLQRVQEETTVSEFLKWNVFLAELEAEPFRKQDKWDYRVARLLAELRRSWVDKPKKVQVTDFLYCPIEKKAPPKSAEEKSRAAKQRVFTALGRPKNVEER